MGSEGSTGAKLDSEKTGVREKTPEVSASSKPTGLEEEGPVTLRCACASVGACAYVSVGAASCATTLMFVVGPVRLTSPDVQSTPLTVTLLP